VSPAAAARDWVHVQKVAQSFDPPLTLVSPAPAGRDFTLDGKSQWLDEFFYQCTNVVSECNPSLIKYIAYHDYKLDTDGMERRITGMYKHYGNRPIWVTEFAMGHQWNPTPTDKQVKDFMKATLTMLENHPAVYRYAWFTARAQYSNWLGNYSLLQYSNPTPTLTAVGQIYKTWPENDGGSPPPPPAPAPTKKPTKSPTKAPGNPDPPTSDFPIDLTDTICPGLVDKDKSKAPDASACAALCASDPGCDVWQYCPQDPQSSSITSCRLYNGDWTLGNWVRCYVSTSTSSRASCEPDSSKKGIGAARAMPRV